MKPGRFWRCSARLANIVTVLAVAFAVYEYFHTVYPVWSKEERLTQAEQELRLARRTLADTERDVSAKQAQLKVVEKLHLSIF